MDTLIRSGSLTNYAEVARAVGLDPRRMLREFALPPRCLEDTELKVPLDSVRQLLEVSAERSGAEAFGLMMAETRQLSNLGPVGLLVREQPTLRRALDVLGRYARRLNEALFLTIDESRDVVVVREEIIVGGGGPVRQSTELAIGVVFRMMRTYVGPDWQPLRICFAHDAPVDRSVHVRVFGRAVEFGHDFNGVVCARKDVERPNPSADPAMARYARQLIDAGFARAPSGTIAQVRGLILALLGTGTCSIDLVAQHMGIDRRTVHRYLQSEGRTYSDLINDVRRELAARYLDNRDRSLAEVSSLLGFAAPSAFSRWYRREFGAAPSAGRAAKRTQTR